MSDQQLNDDKRVRRSEANRRYLFKPEKLEKKRERDREYKRRVRDRQRLMRMETEPSTSLTIKGKQEECHEKPSTNDNSIGDSISKRSIDATSKSDDYRRTLVTEQGDRLLVKKFTDKDFDEGFDRDCSDGGFNEAFDGDIIFDGNFGEGFEGRLDESNEADQENSEA